MKGPNLKTMDPPDRQSKPPDKTADQTERRYNVYEYNQNDTYPYRVIVQLENDAEGKAQINKLTVGKMLSQTQEYKNNIVNMRPLGKNKLLVFLKSHHTANSLQLDKQLTCKGYRAYIPRSFVAVSGVVSGVPIDITIEEIKLNIRSDYPVLSINRLHRYEGANKIETTRISIAFRASTLPKDVRLFCCVNSVRPFVSKPVLCLNCLRYNHRTDSCRSKKRCGNCALQHDGMETGDCPNKKKCLYCKSNSDHRTADEECAERVRQRNIKTIMAKSTMTFMEAKEQNPTLTQNRYEALENAVDFPTLPDSFASMAGGQFRTKNDRQYKPQKPKRTIQEVNIADQVEVLADKKKKVNEKEPTGVALFNKFKVSDFERWAQRFEEQRTQSITQQLSGSETQSGDGTAINGETSIQHEENTADSRQSRYGKTSDRWRRPSTVDWSQAANE